MGIVVLAGWMPVMVNNISAIAIAPIGGARRAPNKFQVHTNLDPATPITGAAYSCLEGAV